MKDESPKSDKTEQTYSARFVRIEDEKKVFEIAGHLYRLEETWTPKKFELHLWGGNFIELRHIAIGFLEKHILRKKTPNVPDTFTVNLQYSTKENDR